MTDMLVAVEVNGIPVTVDRSPISDFDFLEMIYDLQSAIDEGKEPDATAMVPLARGLFGTEQWRNIKQTIREENGGVANSVVMTNFIFEAIKAAAAAIRADEKN